MIDFPADEPKTEREWLMMIAQDVKDIYKKLDGRGGICDTLGTHEKELAETRKWRIYQAVMLIALLVLITGRYIFGPTSIPLVP